jgi:UDP-glucose 4-epimerase
LIPLVLQVLLGQREKLLVFGDDYATPDGTCIRDYIHVDDLAAAHLLAMQATTGATAEVYNVGTGLGHSVLEVIRACEKVGGGSVARETVERRPGDAPALVADPAKLKQRLGWTPHYTNIDDIVATAWKWHRQHPHGYGS